MWMRVCVCLSVKETLFVLLPRLYQVNQFRTCRKYFKTKKVLLFTRSMTYYIAISIVKDVVSIFISTPCSQYCYLSRNIRIKPIHARVRRRSKRFLGCVPVGGSSTIRLFLLRVTNTYVLNSNTSPRFHQFLPHSSNFEIIKLFLNEME